MKQEDNLLRRLQPLENASFLMQKNERFSPVNDKTIGLLLVGGHDNNYGTIYITKIVNVLQNGMRLLNGQNDKTINKISQHNQCCTLNPV